MLIKHLSKIFFITSICLFFYVFYKSELFWDGSKRNYYLIYYLFSLGLFLLFILSIFISKTFKIYLVILILSILFSLYSFEFYLTYKSSNYDRSISKTILDEYKKKTKKDFDQRKKIEVFEDLKKENNDIVVTIQPDQHYLRKDIYPLSGISNSQTIHCNENGYYSTYLSDRYGFNNPDDEWQNESFEYAIVGDSFVHGACVNRPNDIASVIRSLSNNSTLNLGYEGNGPLLEYATLREYLPNKTKKILWFYYEGNDLFFLDYEFTNPIIKKYFLDEEFSQELKLKQNIIDQVLRVKMNELYEIKNNHENETLPLIFNKFSFKLNKVRNLMQKILPNKYQSHATPELQPQFVAIMEKTLNLSKKNNSELIFIYLPEYKRYLKNYENDNYIKIKSEVNKLGIKFIDIHEEVFVKEDDPLSLFPFKKPGHYSVDGYQKISETIYNLIVK